MFISRVFGRTLFAAAKSEAFAAAGSTARTSYNPLEEFFKVEVGRLLSFVLNLGTILTSCGMFC